MLMNGLFGSAVDAAELVLRQGAVVLVERHHARLEVALVIEEQLVAPLLPDGLFVQPQSPEPLARGLAVVLAARVYLHDLVVRVHRGDDVFHARVEAAREDVVRDPEDVLEVLASAGRPVAQDGLQAEP